MKVYYLRNTTSCRNLTDMKNELPKTCEYIVEPSSLRSDHQSSTQTQILAECSKMNIKIKSWSKPFELVP